MLEIIKSEIINATKSGDSVKRDILKLLLGDTQNALMTKNAKSENETITSIAKKIIKNNEETIQLQSDINQVTKLKRENEILSNFVPKTLSQDDILKVIKINNLPKNIGQVMEYFKKNKLTVSGYDVKMVVESL